MAAMSMILARTLSMSGTSGQKETRPRAPGMATTGNRGGNCVVNRGNTVPCTCEARLISSELTLIRRDKN
jgi:hypothetical protein